MKDLLRGVLALPEQASTFAEPMDDLHYFVIGVTMLGWAGVSLVTLWFLVHYHRRLENQRTRQVVVPVLVEVGIVVGLLALFVLWWTIGFRQYVWMQTPPRDALPIYVAAKQWMWKFAYPDGRSAISVLVVPQHRPVKLIMTSQDVLHSFSVPAFRIRQDVIPGRYVTAWFEAKRPGTYQILCAEYCGLSHSRMWGTVVVLSAADYDAWLEATRPGDTMPGMIAGRQAGDRAPDRPASGYPLTPVEPPPATTAKDLVRWGREVAVSYGCLSCHTVDGRQHIGPTWRDLYLKPRPLEGGGDARADDAYLTESMMDPLARVVRGYRAVMPSYQGFLRAAEAAALVEYIRSLRGAPAVVPPGSPPELEDLLQRAHRAPGPGTEQP